MPQTYVPTPDGNLREWHSTGLLSIARVYSSISAVESGPKFSRPRRCSIFDTTLSLYTASQGPGVLFQTTFRPHRVDLSESGEKLGEGLGKERLFERYAEIKAIPNYFRTLA